MKRVNIAVIGLGSRGYSLLRDVINPLEKLNVVAVADYYQDRVDDAAKLVKESTGVDVFKTLDYKEAIDNPQVEAVFVSTSWETHVEVAVYAMNAGKPIGVEVGGAYDIRDCWDLVDTYEKTKTPFMLMENCCFGRREMMVLNMVKQGIFGEIVHCQGGYHHDLRKEISYGKENRHYRLRNYILRNCENYPTHEIGPIAKVLDINHGNRFLYLSSIGSKAAGLRDYVAEVKSDDEELMNTTFNQSDIVVTNIKCANGETVTITLDTTLPRYYSRGFTVRGTKGFYEEMTDSVFLESKGDDKFDFSWRREKSGNAEEYETEYDHPVWKKFISDGIQGSHDGMDWLEFSTFADCIINKEPMPVDVYDAATWMAISALSEQSLAMGSAPVSFPDFTRGKWVKR